MTRDEIMQRAEVAAAMAEGEQVQYRETAKGSNWIVYRNSVSTAGWFLPGLQWRIKPKPLEYWAFFRDGCNLPCDFAPGCYRLDDLPNLKSGRWVRMREIDE